MSRALPSKAQAAEDHAAGDARTHVVKRTARTAAQGGGATLSVLAVTEVTGWERRPLGEQRAPLPADGDRSDGDRRD